MKSGDNAAITNALVELAVKNGKTEDEIAFALGWMFISKHINKYLSIFNNSNKFQFYFFLH